MNRLRLAVCDLFWSAVVLFMACAWTLGMRTALACGLLEDHHASAANRSVAPQKFDKTVPNDGPAQAA